MVAYAHIRTRAHTPLIIGAVISANVSILAGAEENQ